MVSIRRRRLLNQHLARRISESPFGCSYPKGLFLFQDRPSCRRSGRQPRGQRLQIDQRDLSRPGHGPRGLRKACAGEQRRMSSKNLISASRSINIALPPNQISHASCIIHNAWLISKRATKQGLTVLVSRETSTVSPYGSLCRANRRFRRSPGVRAGDTASAAMR